MENTRTTSPFNFIMSISQFVSLTKDYFSDFLTSAHGCFRGERFSSRAMEALSRPEHNVILSSFVKHNNTSSVNRPGNSVETV